MKGSIWEFLPARTAVRGLSSCEKSCPGVDLSDDWGGVAEPSRGTEEDT